MERSNVSTRRSNAETRRAWDTNASFWDERMGEGNDFFKYLEWPSIERLLPIQAGGHILDIACGNGLTSRRLAELGVRVRAIDFSENLIRIASSRTNPGSRITYQVLDDTRSRALRSLGENNYDGALCNMALFDMADVVPLFQELARLLKRGSAFVFSLTHPCFNNTSCVQVMEQLDDQGSIKTLSSVKVLRYLNISQARGIAMRGQPVPQWYFDRPIQYYLQLGFENGFVLDGFEECGFPSDYHPGGLLKSQGNFSEFPLVLVCRLRLLQK